MHTLYNTISYTTISYCFTLNIISSPLLLYLWFHTLATMTASFVCFSMWHLKNWIFLATTTLQNPATQPTLFNNFTSKIFHIWVFNYADTISSRCLTRRLLLSRRLPRLHEGHLQKSEQQSTAMSLNTTTTQMLPQDTTVLALCDSRAGHPPCQLVFFQSSAALGSLQTEV